MTSTSTHADQSGLSDLSASSINLAFQGFQDPELESASAGLLLDGSISSPPRLDLSHSASLSRAAPSSMRSSTPPSLSRSVPKTPSTSRRAIRHLESASTSPNPTSVSMSDSFPKPLSPQEWSPGPEASTSRTGSSSQPARRASANRSLSRSNDSAHSRSHSTTFDFSNASFSESFLRQAGAHMLAGLDEVSRQQTPSRDAAAEFASSSSDMPTHGSSPTIKASVEREDPKTPFVGKTLRTRLAEMGMLHHSPGSSEGSSSPASSSLGWKTPLPMRSGLREAVDEEESQEGDSVLDGRGSKFESRESPSPQAAAIELTKQTEEVLGAAVEQERLDMQGMIHNAAESAAENSLQRDEIGEAEEYEPQGLSVVPEESWIEESQLHSASPILHTSGQIAHSTSSEPNIQSSAPVLSTQQQALTESTSTASTSQDLPKSATASLISIDTATKTPDTAASSPPTSSRVSVSSPSPRRPPQVRPPATPRSLSRLKAGSAPARSPLSQVMTPEPDSTLQSDVWESPSSTSFVGTRFVSSISTEQRFMTPGAKTDALSQAWSPSEYGSAVGSPLATPPNGMSAKAAHKEGGALLESTSSVDRDRRLMQPIKGTLESVESHEESMPTHPGPSADQPKPLEPSKADESDRNAHSFKAASSSPPSPPMQLEEALSYSTPPSSIQRRSRPSVPQHPASGDSDNLLSSPATTFGTPSAHSPSPTSRLCAPGKDDQQSLAEVGKHVSRSDEEEEDRDSCPSSSASTASSTSSNSSERKLEGETSSNAVVEATSLTRRNEVKRLSVRSIFDHDTESPSVVKNLNLQLQRVAKPASSADSNALLEADFPEVAAVSNVFSQLSTMHRDHANILTSKLARSEVEATRLEELLSVSETRNSELTLAYNETRDHLEEVRYSLSRLQSQYEELISDSDNKDQRILQLLCTLQGRLEAGSRTLKTSDAVRLEVLEAQLEEERRQKEVQRRDFEVRIQGLLLHSAASSVQDSISCERQSQQGFEGINSEEKSSETELQNKIAEAKEMVRRTLEKDFEIRSSFQHNALEARIQELEAQLLTMSKLSPSDHASIDSSSAEQTRRNSHDREAEQKIEELTATLDSRFEEVMDLRTENENLVAQLEASQLRVQELEETLDTQACQEMEGDLEGQLTEQQEEIDRLQETLQLTQSRLASVVKENEVLRVEKEEANAQLRELMLLHQRDGGGGETAKAEATEDQQTRIRTLENHILDLEMRLRSTQSGVAGRHGGAERETPTQHDASEPTSSQRDDERVLGLEREISDLNLRIVKLEKANSHLQEDNIHFSIALSAKQLELGMIKRNARFALKSQKQEQQQQQQAKVPTVAETKFGHRVKHDEKMTGLPKHYALNQNGAQAAQRNPNFVSTPAAQISTHSFPKVPTTQLMGYGASSKEEEDKENFVQERSAVPPNPKRILARQMLAQRQQERER